MSFLPGLLGGGGSGADRDLTPPAQLTLVCFFVAFSWKASWGLWQCLPGQCLSEDASPSDQQPAELLRGQEEEAKLLAEGGRQGLVPGGGERGGGEAPLWCVKCS